MKSFMVDSTVFVEHLKGNPTATDILEALIEESVAGYINETVASEVVFIYLKLKTGKSFRTLKKKPELVRTVQKGPVYGLLSLFRFLETNEFVFSLSKKLIEKYGLLPNDAIIGATAIFYNLDGIITLDKDFAEMAQNENLLIVSSKEELLNL
ncbi:type II toxin-antitoxin system VapC family toxin [Thermococcus sp. 21S7]|uniref:type II toxin-antitoxin system VapC family toxin n=1 Tax=Thermococcus sp. 21S7 TaxID=1638221 RepID=UPI00143B9A9F|nr:type II toxin-antitoxin system VapC family toxin [Thermococcus sp. 21S7]NJE60224.1 PIN domain-containing protein [Thermococcus sp. 21S7]